MKLEQIMDWGWDGGSRRSSPRAEALTKEMVTFAAAARSSGEGPEMSVSGAECEIGSLSWGCAPGDVAQGAATGLADVFVRKVISCVAQSIDGFCWSNHKYPRTADVE